jgi:hypothetical protein
MDAYCQGEYERAWDEAQRFNTPGFFWDALIRATALGQLGRRTDAEKASAEVLTIMPDF